MHELNRDESRVTLRMAWESYREIRKISDATAVSYEHILYKYIPEWLDCPIESINKRQVLQKHQELSGRLSGTTANKALRVAKAMTAYAMAFYELQINNPFVILSTVRAWNKEKRRTGYIPEHKMPDWFKAVEQDRSRVLRDYLKFLMLTGLRRSEAAEMPWENVDLEHGTFSVYKTKNGEDLHLPLSSYSWQMLRLRRESFPSDDLVFSGFRGDPFNIHYMHLRRIEWACGMRFTPHDLRRTFLTIGESVDIPLHLLKELANHKQNKDITLSYIQLGVNRLRPQTEKIAERIVELWLSRKA